METNDQTTKPTPSPGATCSAWPDTPGFYWWRGAPSFRWQMMQVVAFGDDSDQGRYMVYDVESHHACRSLKIWKERGPECGEWIAIPKPETLLLGVERMGESGMIPPSAPGGNPLPNAEAGRSAGDNTPTNQ